MLTYLLSAAQGRVGDIIDELFGIRSEYLGFISSNLAKVETNRHLFLCPNLRRVFHLYFYDILVDSTLATRRIGEQKFSCLQFSSSAHDVASEVMETFCVFVQIQYWYEWYCSCILLFILAEIKVKDMPRVCLRTLLLTGCHGNEASTRNCEKVVFYFTIDFSRYLGVAKSKRRTSDVCSQ